MSRCANKRGRHPGNPSQGNTRGFDGARELLVSVVEPVHFVPAPFFVFFCRIRLNLQSNSTVAVGFKLVQQICNNTPASSLETVESRMN